MDVPVVVVEESVTWLGGGEEEAGDGDAEPSLRI